MQQFGDSQLSFGLSTSSALLYLSSSPSSSLLHYPFSPPSVRFPSRPAVPPPTISPDLDSPSHALLPPSSPISPILPCRRIFIGTPQVLSFCRHTSPPQGPSVCLLQGTSASTRIGRSARMQSRKCKGGVRAVRVCKWGVRTPGGCLYPVGPMEARW